MTAQRGGLGHAALLTATAAVVLPAAALVTSPLLARALGPEGRGDMSAVITPVTFLAGLTGLGVPAAIVYYTSRGELPVRRLRTLCAITVLVGILAAGALVTSSDFVLQRHPAQAGIFAVIAATLPVVLLQDTLRAYAVGSGRYRRAVVERWISGSLRFVLIVTAFATGHLSVVAVAVSLSWAPGLCTVLMYLPLLSRDPTPTTSGTEPTGRVLRYALRAWSGTLAALLFVRLAQLYLGVFAAASELGYYVIAVAVADVPLMAAQALRDLIVSAAGRRGDVAMIGRVVRVLVVASSVSAVAIAVLAPAVIPLVFGADFLGAVPVVQTLAISTVFSCAGSPLSAGLAALGRPEMQAVAQVVALAVSLSLLLLLVPRAGAHGAAWATVAAQVVSSGIMLALFRRYSGQRLREVLAPQAEDVRAVTRPLSAPLRRRRSRGSGGPT